jgi:hypothetical protein
MNKLITVLLMGLLTWTAAAQASEREVQPAQYPAYIEAIRVAASSVAGFNCTNGHRVEPSNSSLTSINSSYVAQITVSTVGTQPLIKVTSRTGSAQLTLEITTNEARTAILAYRKLSYAPGRVNTGTLDNPNIIDSWILTEDLTCTTVSN